MSGTAFDPRVTAYFGDPVLRAGFMVTPHLLLRHFRALGLSAEHVVLIQLLMETTWDLADPPDTMQKLADRMGVSVRTVQRYSEYLVAQRLVVVYDQFSAGAQIGNAYDLSPLFQRLAGLAPTEAGSSATTERRVRDRGPERPALGSSPPVTYDTLPGDITDIPKGDTDVIPRDDTVAIPVVTAMSGFNKNTQKQPEKAKKPRKQLLLSADYEQAAGQDSTRLSNPAAHAGYSLRWQRPLEAVEVRESAALLKRMGIGDPLRALLAPTVAPAEVWALWAYSGAKGWRTGLIISQIYDRATKQARPAAEILPEHDEVGQLLANLPHETAAAVLRRVLALVPAREEELFNEPSLRDGSDIQRETARRLARMIAHVRSPESRSSFRSPAGYSRLLQCSVDTVNNGSETIQANAAIWQKIQDELAAQLPRSDWETWIKPAALLELDQTSAVVGTPNIFVRQEVGQRYRQYIERALAVELGYPLQVEVVIGTATGLPVGP